MIDIRKTCILCIAVAAMTAPAAAATASFNASTDVLRPGANQSIGHITVTEDWPATLQPFTDNARIPLYYDTVNTTTDNATRTWTVDVTADLPPQYPAGNYTPTVFTQTNRSAATADTPYQVAAVSDWTLTDDGPVDTQISVGEAGAAWNTTIQQRGNVEETVDARLEGNVSRVLSTESSYTVQPTQDRVLRLAYDLFRGQRFGRYTGNLTVSNDTVKTVIPITVKVQDDIAPDMQDADADDVMATLPARFGASVEENTNLSGVNVHVLRSTTVEQGNETVVVNRSAARLQLQRQPGTDRFTAEWTDTDVQGRYWAVFTAVDASGNNASAVRRFDIDRLDVTSVKSTNFRLASMRSKEQTGTDLIENDEESPFSVRLSSFRYFGNTTVDVGIRPPEAEQPQYFDDVGQEMEFSEPGTYQVVVNSREEEREDDVYEYDAELAVAVPPQHVHAPGWNVTFGGSVNSRAFPAAACALAGGALKECAGYGVGSVLDMYRERYGDINTTHAVRLAVVDRSECEGVTRWGDCTSFETQAEERAQKDDSIISKLRNHRAGLLAALIFSNVAWLSWRRKGPYFYGYSFNDAPEQEV